MNPIQALFERILQFAFDLVGQLIRGILRAPVTAVENAALPEIDVRMAPTSELIDLRHKVLRPGRPRQTAFWNQDDDEQTRHWVAKHDGVVIGIASVMRMDAPPEDPDAKWQLRGMAVDPTWQGKGVGRVVLRAAEAEVAEPMWANARVTALAFYERNGWQAVGEAFEIEGVGPHVRIHRAL